MGVDQKQRRILKRQNSKGSMLGGFFDPSPRVHSLSVIRWLGRTPNVLDINISEFTFCKHF